MQFNSLTYLLFIPIVFTPFWLIKDKYRWIVLLLASIVFYAWLQIPYLLIVLLLITLSTYFFALQIQKQDANEKRKKQFFWFGLSINLLVLIYLKYLPFLITNINGLLRLFSSLNLPMSKVLVSVGISFYTFQTISYLIDVYLGKIQPEKHLGYFALYLCFFPKILQGPIERASKLLPQLKKPYEFNYMQTREGLILFVWGMFKKIVIADRLAFLVNTVFDKPEGVVGIPMIITIYAFAIQIYMDFSGYTDMALGTAKLFGIELTDNFRYPYAARSVTDFWRRWHITFSTWLQDYLFKPLQMKFRYWKVWGTIFALMITFFISGLWHGASWTFIIWGLLHGIYLSLDQVWLPYKKKLNKKFHLETNKLWMWFEIFITFNLVSFAWIFFRSGSLGLSCLIIRNIVKLKITGLPSFYNGISFFGKFNYSIIAISIFIYFLKNILKFKMFNQILRFCFYILFLLFILLMNFNANFQYIYNQF